jgi:hypothetical protein
MHQLMHTAPLQKFVASLTSSIMGCGTLYVSIVASAIPLSTVKNVYFTTELTSHLLMKRKKMTYDSEIVYKEKNE